MENNFTQDFLSNFPNHGYRYLYDPSTQSKSGINSQVEKPEMNEGKYGAYFTVNGFQGGYKETNLVSLNAFFADIDWEEGIDITVKKQRIQNVFIQCEELNLSPSYIVETKKGCHIYWILEKPETKEKIEEWKAIENTIIEKIGGDDNAKDPCRILRIPGTKHWKDPLNPFTIKIWCDTGSRYSWEQIKKVFPPSLIHGKAHQKTPLTALVGLKQGGEGRNPAIAKLIGKLIKNLHHSKWREEVLPVALSVNQTYQPPLDPEEVLKVFDSIGKMELRARSKKQLEEKKSVNAIEIATETLPDGTIVPTLQMSSKGGVFNNEQNVLRNLHYYFKDRLKYNTFTERIEFDGRDYQDDDVGEIVAFMQTEGRMPTIPRRTVELALITYALRNSYDEARDYLEALVWDGQKRLETWLVQATGIESTPFNKYAPAQWLQNGLVRRLWTPFVQWHQVLAVIGGQGTGKTSLFQALGGKWYKSYAGGADSKDLAILCTGAAIMDLDEGVAVSKVDYARMKSFISQPNDEYRSPYARRSTKHVRRFVFSMTTNSSTPLRDPTGNRRYWIINTKNNKIDFEWVRENRDQLFAEALHNIKNDIELPEVPFETATENQEDAIMDDPWTNDVLEYLSDKNETTSRDIFIEAIEKRKDDSDFKSSLFRLDRFVDMRISEILSKNGFEKRRVMRDTVRKYVWFRIDPIEIIAKKIDF